LVVVLEREDAGIWPVRVRQELAQRLRVFEERRLQRLEAIPLVDRANRLDHRANGDDVARQAIFKAAREPRIDQCLCFAHGSLSSVGCYRWWRPRTLGPFLAERPFVDKAIRHVAEWQ